MLSDEDTTELLKMFPPVEYAFAYGSGAVEQGGYDYQKKKSFPMLDIILVVEDSEAWHRSNLSMNPSHYTSMIPHRPSMIALFQERIPAYMWFNTYVSLNLSRFPDRKLKYGVISKKHMLRDLTDWDQLYCAGRLHKPVKLIQANEAIQQAIETNKEQAVRTSLLLLPSKFNEIELYLTIASLSYIGDPRMLVGENPKKVKPSEPITFIFFTLFILYFW